MADHLRPTAAIAADAILPDDPGLALALAQELVEKPLMANHHHGLWGYSGAHAGRALTIQSTGIGGPSGAAVLTELAVHGVRRAIALGRCESLDARFSPASALSLVGALGDDGVSAALGARESAPDPALAAALAAAGPELGRARAAGFDLAADPSRAARLEAWCEAGAGVADMRSAALLALGPRLGVAVACVCVVDADDPSQLERVEAALLAAGAVAARALAAP